MTENPFRNPAGGPRYQRALFLEESDTKDTVLYTLKDQDTDGFPSLYRLYIELEDPIEWNFAQTYFDGWEHWTSLCEAPWFQPYITRWRHELELKIRSKALLAIRNDASSESRTATNSAKFLLEKGWGEKATKGRPSKVEIKREARRQAELLRDFNDDLSRIKNLHDVPTSTQ